MVSTRYFSLFQKYFTVENSLFTIQYRLLTTLEKKPFESIVAFSPSIFSFSHNVFYPSQIEQNLICCLQMVSIWTSLKICCLVELKVINHHASIFKMNHSEWLWSISFVCFCLVERKLILFFVQKLVKVERYKFDY